MNIFFICVLVFCSRIIDVSLGTIRTTIVVKGKHLIGSLIGFIEITVWFVVVQQVLALAGSNFWVILAYALGFSTGTYIGGRLTNILFKTKIGVQIVTNKNNDLIQSIRDHGFAVSILNVVSDKRNKKYMLFLEMDSHRFNKLKEIVKNYDSKAFIVVNETVYVQNGYFGLNK